MEEFSQLERDAREQRRGIVGVALSAELHAKASRKVC
jgi:hypothetical protein